MKNIFLKINENDPVDITEDWTFIINVEDPHDVNHHTHIEHRGETIIDGLTHCTREETDDAILYRVTPVEVKPT